MKLLFNLLLFLFGLTSVFAQQNNTQVPYFNQAVYFTLNRMTFNFDEFTDELGAKNVDLLNKPKTAIGFEYLFEYQKINTGIHLAYVARTASLVDDLEARNINTTMGLSVSYSLLEDKKIDIRPRLEFNLHNIRLKNYKTDEQSLAEYTNLGEVNLLFKEPSLALGVQLNYRIPAFFSNKKQYYTLGLQSQYQFDIKNKTKISASKQNIKTNSKIDVSGFAFRLHFTVFI